MQLLVVVVSVSSTKRITTVSQNCFAQRKARSVCF